MKTIITESDKETRETGKKVAEEVLEKKKAPLLALKGDLGGGKTTFLKGFAKVLGVKEDVLSPTFLIFRKYKVNHPDFDFFYHFDCYRIEKEKEVMDLGFSEIIENSRNIVALEWSEKVENILPEKREEIGFQFKGKNKRKITFF